MPTLEEVRDEARNRLKGICGVYRICDGNDMRLCEGHSYGSPLNIGGVGSGYSFFNNFRALEKIRLKARLVTPHFTPDTKFSFLGHELSMPIMGASASGVNSWGGEDVITEAEYCRDTVLGCKAAGTISFRGDSFNYSLEEPHGINAIREAEGWGVQIVKPRDNQTIIEFFKLAEEAGAIAVGVDVDGCGSDAMARHDQPTFKKSPEDIQELVSSTKLPVVIKGIMCAEDAIAAVDAGASVISVSNHGGRVLDHTPGTIEVLPEIVAAVKGKALVTCDGGVRTGYDALKMLALGADAILVGRDVIRAAVGGGIEGVQLHMDYLRQTLAKAMLMTNCQSLGDITKEILL
jgi:isopentenyl diphosphate isomerase/L-lactate dehydrogenase-like FMN-dependent dehydrogenase